MTICVQSLQQTNKETNDRSAQATLRFLSSYEDVKDPKGY